MRLNTLSYLPSEYTNERDLLPFIEIFADRFRVCGDCPTNLRERAIVLCLAENERVNAQVCRAYRARLLP